MNALRIKDWADNFQLSQNSRIGVWGKLPIPIRLDGEHYRRLMGTPAGRSHYAVFLSLAAVAANMPVRGVLAKDDGPLSEKALHIRTGIPTKALRASIEALKSPEVGWLIATAWTPSTPRLDNGEHTESAPPVVGASQSQPAKAKAIAKDEPKPSASANGAAAARSIAPLGPEAAGGFPNLDIVRALAAYWPSGRAAQELASHPNATPLRVLWMLERARTEKIRNKDGPAGFIRTGIEEGWEIWPEWLNKNRRRLEQAGLLISPTPHPAGIHA